MTTPTLREAAHLGLNALQHVMDQMYCNDSGEWALKCGFADSIPLEAIEALDAALAAQPVPGSTHSADASKSGAQIDISQPVPDAPAHGWLRSGGLLYRLTDDKRPQNRDEINVTMADGSRTDEARGRRAGELLDMIAAAHPKQPARVPLTEAEMSELAAEAETPAWGDWYSDEDALLRYTRAVEAWHGIVPAPTTDQSHPQR